LSSSIVSDFYLCPETFPYLYSSTGFCMSWTISFSHQTRLGFKRPDETVPDHVSMITAKYDNSKSQNGHFITNGVSLF
jgi:hypothetical protein